MSATPCVRQIVTAVAAIAISCGAPLILGVSAKAGVATHCMSAEYRQFDFWIGEWDTFEAEQPNSHSIAKAKVAPIAGGCALHERYEQSDGLVGESILSFDPVRQQWQQTWVTNRGSNMVLWGGAVDGAIVLEGTVHLHDRTAVLQRITWRKEGESVRETAVLSRDGGQNWEPSFDVLFRTRHASPIADGHPTP